MTISAVIALLALVIAAGAVAMARRTARKFDRLSEAYWELRYEYGQLSSRVGRLEEAGQPAAEETAGPRPIATAFVPLSSLKR